MNEINKIKVYWIDAVIYSASSVGNKLKLQPNQKITEGILEKKNKEGLIVKEPYTINIKTGERDIREKLREATFLFIPHGMIQKVE